MLAVDSASRASIHSAEGERRVADFSVGIAPQQALSLAFRVWHRTLLVWQP
jgi:hypothetical protein